MVCLGPRDPVDIAGPRPPSDVVVRPLNFTVRSRMQLRYRLVVALAAAAILTFGLAGLAAALMDTHPTIAEALFWPNTLLQGLAPCPPLRVGDVVGCEGTPVNFFMFIASFVLSFLVYGSAAYVLLGRANATSNNRWRGP